MILSLRDVPLRSEEEVGSKAWNLAKVLSEGLRVPVTFLIPSTEVSRMLMEGLRHKIFELSRSLLSEDWNYLFEMERELKSSLSTVQVPEELLEELMRAIDGSIRDIAIIRPSPFSQGISEGDLKGRISVWYFRPERKELLRAIQRVLSESFNLRMLARIHDLGLYPEDLSLALMIQEVIVARSSGVAVCCPARRNEIVIKSTWGSFDERPSDRFRVGIDLGEVIESEINEKKTKLLPTDKGLKEFDVEADLWLMPSISKEEVMRIASISLSLSRIFGTPNVIEWIIQEGTNDIFIIQAYKESEKPKIKSLERKVIDMIQSRAVEVATIDRRKQQIPQVIKEMELPPIGSRVYLFGHNQIFGADGSVLTQEHVMKGEIDCSRAVLLIDESETLREEVLERCKSLSIILRPSNISSTIEVAKRIMSYNPSIKLILYLKELGMAFLPGISEIFKGVVVPIDIISDGRIFEGFLRILKDNFKSIIIDLGESLPSVDLLSSLIKIGADFILSEGRAIHQARLISRAESRVFLEYVRGNF
jgi:pyruvate,water dikinase